jgi:hypothetical protein
MNQRQQAVIASVQISDRFEKRIGYRWSSTTLI